MRTTGALGAVLAAALLIAGCGSHAVATKTAAETTTGAATKAPAATRTGPGTTAVGRASGCPHTPPRTAGRLTAASRPKPQTSAVTLPLVRPGAVAATVCQYAVGVAAAKATDMARRLILTGQAAAGLAAVLDGSVPAGPAALSCTSQQSASFVQEVIFRYRSGPAAVVTVAETPCPASTAVAGDRAEVVPSQAHADLFGYTSVVTGGAGPPAPGLIGLTAAQAIAAARHSHVSVVVDGAVIDQAAGSGTVVFQSPQAGARTRIAGQQLDVLIAAHSAPACRPAQLALSYLGGGAGAGNDFGTVLIRDTSARRCTLVGPVLATGLSRSGRAVTRTVRMNVRGTAVLSPVAGPVRWLAAGTMAGTRPGELTGLVTLAAEYRDGPANVDNGDCEPLWVIPATWRIALPDGTRTVANAGSSRCSASRVAW